MFDKLIDIIIQFWDMIIPVDVIYEYQAGVILRRGKLRAVVGPGLHLKIPLLEICIKDDVVPTTINLPCQSLITNDDKSVVVKGIIKYKISDIKTFLLEVNDAVDAISDMTQSIIKNIIMDRSFAECREENLDSDITTIARTESKKWGISIIRVTLSDIGIMRSIRLFTDQVPPDMYKK